MDIDMKVGGVGWKTSKISVVPSFELAVNLDPDPIV